MQLWRSICLVLSTAVMATFAVAIADTANASTSQSPKVAGYFMLRNKNGLCLSVDGGKTTPAGIVIQMPCTSQPDQWWQGRQDGDTGWLVNYKSQLCLWPNAGLLRNGQYLEQTTCTHDITQKWNFYTGQGGDNVILDRKGSNFAVSVHQPVGGAGSRAMLYGFAGHDSPDQHWLYFYG
jgi:hypothetical protein